MTIPTDDIAHEKADIMIEDILVEAKNAFDNKEYQITGEYFAEAIATLGMLVLINKENEQELTV